MKVLHLAAGNLFGGVETYLLTLARSRHLCPTMEPAFGVCFPGRLRDELTAAGVPVHDLGAVRLSHPWSVLRARGRLKRVIRNAGITVVVTHGMWPHAVFGPAVKRAGVRLVNAVHDLLDTRFWLNRWAARTLPDAVTANSRFTAGPASALFPGVEIAVNNYPGSPTTLDSGEARREVRRELGTPAGAVVILQASRLERWKGQAVHVEALGLLKDVTGWEAWFAGGDQKAGESAFLAELKKRVQELGIAERVKFLGQRSDVPRLMAAADIFCQPNAGPEPFGIVFIEALQARIPVVTSAMGGAAEIVTPECGILVKPGDAPMVSDALRGLIADASRRKTLGQAGTARAIELCEPTRQLAGLARILAGEALNEPR
ncbi:MAG TPA: glycosyltransferase family 4 protein [Gemmata sp.]|nr:glycosyltransferase family 4 protein [Gemmata sp.]